MTWKKGIIYLAVVLLLLGIFFDEQITQFIIGMQSNLGITVMNWITTTGTWLVVLFFMTSLFLWSERKRKWILPLWLSLGISFLITQALKWIVMRERPFESLLLNYAPSVIGSGFPSGHTAAVFSSLAVLDKEFPRLKWVWIIIAVLVAFSRLYLGAHYLSDVVAGGLIGFLVGKGVVRVWGINSHTRHSSR